MGVEATPRHTLKDHIFQDLFKNPDRLLRCYQELHPEQTNVSTKDLERITLDRDLLNQMHNDLAFTVERKLVILMEAQAKWGYGILIRLLIYLGMIYTKFISMNGLNIHELARKSVPEPEFYIVYVGTKRKNPPKWLSMAKDFFQNQFSWLNLKARVIYAEDENDILGQYIIFCHVLDEQIKGLGKTKDAVREAIRICKSRNVLKEYLMSREKEVIDMVDVLFDEKRNAQLDYRDTKIKGAVTFARSCGMTKQQIEEQLKNAFKLTDVAAWNYAELYWDASDDDDEEAVW